MTCGVPANRGSSRSAALAVSTAGSPGAAGPRRRHTRRGGRLMMAFQALEAFPALAESRNELLSLVTKDHRATADVISAIESDVALTAGILRLANTGHRGCGHIDTVAAAIGLLANETVQALAAHVGTFDFFGRASIWDSAPEHFRLHALATQRVADRIASEAGYANRDRLAVTSLLHDVGKLVLIHAHPGYPSQVHNGARTPEERILRERRELGVDHAMAGGVLIRRWRLPASLATPIERHHNPDAEGEAALIRLADIIAHYEVGACVSSSTMLHSARAVGLGPQQLRRLVHELPGPNRHPRQRQIDPSPLTFRQLTVLEHLAKGNHYNQIAHDLALSPSTVRSHLQKIYRNLGVANRAQAVLIADERGWLSAQMATGSTGSGPAPSA